MTDLCIPATLVAGDRWAWDDPAPFTAYPPSGGWSLTYHMAPASGGAITTITATDGGDRYALELDKATTAALVPGPYRWSAIVASAIDRVTLGGGSVTVAPDPATATGDTRSDAQRRLDAIDATLEGRATKDADSFTIEGRSIARTPMPDLLRLRAHFAAQVRGEAGRGPITYRRHTI